MHRGDGPVVPVGEVVLTDSGRVTISANVREMYDIDCGDAVHIFAQTKDGDTFVSPNLRVGSEGRVRIPKNHRELFGLSDGDHIDIDVQPAQREYPT